MSDITIIGLGSSELENWVSTGNPTIDYLEGGGLEENGSITFSFNGSSSFSEIFIPISFSDYNVTQTNEISINNLVFNYRALAVDDLDELRINSIRIYDAEKETYYTIDNQEIRDIRGNWTEYTLPIPYEMQSDITQGTEFILSIVFEFDDFSGGAYNEFEFEPISIELESKTSKILSDNWFGETLVENNLSSTKCKVFNFLTNLQEFYLVDPEEHPNLTVSHKNGIGNPFGGMHFDVDGTDLAETAYIRWDGFWTEFNCPPQATIQKITYASIDHRRAIYVNNSGTGINKYNAGVVKITSANLSSQLLTPGSSTIVYPTGTAEIWDTQQSSFGFPIIVNEPATSNIMLEIQVSYDTSGKEHYNFVLDNLKICIEWTNEFNVKGETVVEFNISSVPKLFLNTDGETDFKPRLYLKYNGSSYFIGETDFTANANVLKSVSTETSGSTDALLTLKTINNSTFLSSGETDVSATLKGNLFLNASELSGETAITSTLIGVGLMSCVWFGETDFSSDLKAIGKLTLTEIEGETSIIVSALEDALAGIRNATCLVNGETDFTAYLWIKNNISVNIDGETSFTANLSSIRLIYSNDWNGETSTQIPIGSINNISSDEWSGETTLEANAFIDSFLSTDLSGETTLTSNLIVIKYISCNWYGETDFSSTLKYNSFASISWDGETSFSSEIKGIGVLSAEYYGETVATNGIFASGVLQANLESETSSIFVGLDNALGGIKNISVIWSGETDVSKTLWITSNITLNLSGETDSNAIITSRQTIVSDNWNGETSLYAFLGVITNILSDNWYGETIASKGLNVIAQISSNWNGETDFALSTFGIGNLVSNNWYGETDLKNAVLIGNGYLLSPLLNGETVINNLVLAGNGILLSNEWNGETDFTGNVIYQTNISTQWDGETNVFAASLQDALSGVSKISAIWYGETDTALTFSANAFITSDWNGETHITDLSLRTIKIFKTDQWSGETVVTNSVLIGTGNLISDDWHGETNVSIQFQGSSFINVSWDGETVLTANLSVLAHYSTSDWNGETFAQIEQPTKLTNINVSWDGETALTSIIEDVFGGIAEMTAIWSGETDLEPPMVAVVIGSLQANWQGETIIQSNICGKQVWYLGNLPICELYLGDKKIVEAYLGNVCFWKECQPC